jgi:xylulokinase
MSTMSVIGLDIGTTGCKAIVFGDQWEILGRAGREYGISTPRAGWYEQDAEHVWVLAMEALQEALTTVRGDAPQALALSVQGEATIPVDARGRALRPAILGMDTRTSAENEWLAHTFGAETLFQRTGIPMHTMNTITNLLWLQKHEPALWRRADRFLLYEDYFLSRLGGEAYISPCLASRTQMLDIHAGAWMDDILETCKIDTERLAKLATPGRPLGCLQPAVSQALGLAGDVALLSGGHDQACAALGCGVIQSGLAMVSTGTAEVVEVAMAQPMLADELRRGGISVYLHVIPNLSLAMTLNHSGGLCLRWLRDTLCRDKLLEAMQVGDDAYDRILAGVTEGPTRLMVLPHFSGAGTPLLDNRSRAALLGLDFATRQADIAKALLEGLCFELKCNLDLLQRAGIPIRELRAVGGGSRSPLWIQLKADIGQVPLRIPRVTEAACLGAAILAAVGIGHYRDYADAVRDAVRLDQTVTPDPINAKAYEPRFKLYQRLYPALIGLQSI